VAHAKYENSRTDFEMFFFFEKCLNGNEIEGSSSIFLQGHIHNNDVTCHENNISNVQPTGSQFGRPWLNSRRKSAPFPDP
jgi:hypothetical protein